MGVCEPISACGWRFSEVCVDISDITGISFTMIKDRRIIPKKLIQAVKFLQFVGAVLDKKATCMKWLLKAFRMRILRTRILHQG